jgi:hypothetical protein
MLDFNSTGGSCLASNRPTLVATALQTIARNWWQSLASDCPKLGTNCLASSCPKLGTNCLASSCPKLVATALQTIARNCLASSLYSTPGEVPAGRRLGTHTCDTGRGPGRPTARRSHLRFRRSISSPLAHRPTVRHPRRDQCTGFETETAPRGNCQGARKVKRIRMRRSKQSKPRIVTRKDRLGS